MNILCSEKKNTFIFFLCTILIKSRFFKKSNLLFFFLDDPDPVELKLIYKRYF
jgi:hypothetical protein